MFLERYWDLLKPGGRILTVIDDGILSGSKHAAVRHYLREHFIIRAIISLHGDAFQRSGARAKTSIVYLTKRDMEQADTQPNIFVYESRYIGLDDVVPRTRESVAAAARVRAKHEMDQIENAFRAFMEGKDQACSVAADRLTGRLDAKYLLPWNVDSLKTTWEANGATLTTLGELVDLVEEPVSIGPDGNYTFLRISYEGRAEGGENALGREISYNKVGRTKPGDIVVSNISAVYKAICVIPPGAENLLVSNEFTVLRLKEGSLADPQYLWSVLRSSAVIAEWMSGSSGVGRHRVDWSVLQNQAVPLLPPPQQRLIGDSFRRVEQLEKEADAAKEIANESLSILDLESLEAREKLEKAKPPK